MQFTSTLLASTLLSLAAAAPAALAVSAAAADTAWTLRNVTRACDAGNTACAWSFSIDTSADGSALTACPYAVNSTATAGAAQAPGGPATCGAFTVTSSWSDQFGAGTGFTTFAVADYAQKLIAYPSYTDAELANNATVTPDRSYPVQTLQ